jgi:hypothetical protein
MPSHHFAANSSTHYPLAVILGWPSPMAQPAWPQLQEISVVSPASSQYGLQYLVSSSTPQLHAGWAHCLILSDMIVSPSLAIRRSAAHLSPQLNYRGQIHILFGLRR